MARSRTRKEDINDLMMKDCFPSSLPSCYVKKKKEGDKNKTRNEGGNGGEWRQQRDLAALRIGLIGGGVEGRRRRGLSKM